MLDTLIQCKIREEEALYIATAKGNKDYQKSQEIREMIWKLKDLESFGVNKIKEIEDRVVITYQNGEEPTFNGERLLQLANQEENVRKFRTKSKIEDKEEVLITTRA